MLDYFTGIVNRWLAGRAPATWIVGLSGGVDSRVLLDLCLRYREAAVLPPRLVAAHLNHKLRGEASDEDEAFCQSLCEAEGIPFFSETLDVQALATGEGVGLESAGRLARHRLFARLGAEHAPATVLLAHHHDDQLETVALRQERGAGPAGLAGMRQETALPVDGAAIRIFRPLLEIPKSEILAYARARGLRWREDESNRDPAFARNRIRTELSAGTPAASLRKRELEGIRLCATRERDRWEAEARRFVRAHARIGAGLALCPIPPATELLEQGETLPFVLRHICLDAFASLPPDRRAYDAFRHLVAEGRTGESADLGGGLVARREHDGIAMFRQDGGGLPVFSKTDGDEAGSAALPEALPFSVEAGGCRWTAGAADIMPDWRMPEEDRRSATVEWVDADAVAWPLRVRGRRPGDRFRPLGAPGSKRVKDFLIDAGVPRRHRDEVRIVEDAEGRIVWVAPLRLDETARLAESTSRAVRIEMESPTDPVSP